MDYDEGLTTSYLDTGGGGDDGAGSAVWTTTMLATVTNVTSVAQSRVLGLYDILIPLLGAFIIVLNLAVVVSSGLILKKGKWTEEVGWVEETRAAAAVPLS